MDMIFKILNLRDALNNDLINPNNYNCFFNAILVILKDISKEIDELNEFKNI